MDVLPARAAGATRSCQGRPPARPPVGITATTRWLYLAPAGTFRLARSARRNYASIPSFLYPSRAPAISASRPGWASAAMCA